ncbi:hypothetical protein TSOC_001191 [Tetrabaena socialis]|uniref:Uncharacterized protein n=1 Tax=Tetrabaena socialis TaxID=47790 RepID=A0A2J8AHA7_9CHLO|nr:hypothetical protein TSOC_001191 [Tetrabaena socialis]|eukprot:PNH11903.1 hypothetical protein TSOC_001191 [Tetrabaena socialis]
MQASLQSSRIVAGTSGRNLVATPSRRRTGRSAIVQPAQAFFGEPSAMDAISAVSQIATTSALCVGAFMLLGRANGPSQDHLNSEPCPVCHGSGFEACLCSRWSDGDAGCSSCSKTGYMRCRGCGGGGIATPLAVKVRK